MEHGFVKVATAIPATRIADVEFNTIEIIRLLEEAEQKGVEIIVFPELCLTSYTCADLFLQKFLLDRAKKGLQKILNHQAGKDLTYIIGMPLFVNDALYNVAVICRADNILGIVPKTYLPNYKEFYEQRWFAQSSILPETCKIELFGKELIVNSNTIFEHEHCTFAVELCEDLWSPIPPSETLSVAGAQIIFNLSASNELISKHHYLKSLISQQSARCLSGYIYASSGFGESTQDLVFGGNAFIFENGSLLAESKRFSIEPQLVISEIDIDLINNERRVNTTFKQSQQTISNISILRTNISRVDSDSYNQVSYIETLDRVIDPHPFVPQGSALDERCQEILSIQVLALAKRIMHTHAKNVVIGISGGLDSTLALLVCIQAMDKLHIDRSHVIGVTMPGFGTTDRTYNNAVTLIKNLGATFKEISIKAACEQHFKDINHDISIHDVTYENGQARERTQILFDLANQEGGFVVGTGDLSELALGWATYNADHMSAYGVNCSIPKTLVKHLVNWVAQNCVNENTKQTLHDIIDTPVSPELLPPDSNGQIVQKTEDLVGPYELHDFFLFHFLRHGYTPSKIFFLATQAHFEIQYTKAYIAKWLYTFFQRFFSQQFKRSCLPDGPKVGSISLSPRGDWRMPSDASSSSWLKECKIILDLTANDK